MVTYFIIDIYGICLDCDCEIAPARLVPTPTGPVEARRAPVRAYADSTYRAQNPGWDRKIAPAGSQARVAVMAFVQSLQAFPPRQRPGTFTVDQVLEALYQQGKP